MLTTLALLLTMAHANPVARDCRAARRVLKAAVLGASSLDSYSADGVFYHGTNLRTAFALLEEDFAGTERPNVLPGPYMSSSYTLAMKYGDSRARMMFDTPIVLEYRFDPAKRARVLIMPEALRESPRVQTCLRHFPTLNAEWRYLQELLDLDATVDGAYVVFFRKAALLGPHTPQDLQAMLRKQANAPSIYAETIHSMHDLDSRQMAHRALRTCAEQLGTAVAQ